jgi:hypothetical protein
MGEKIGEKMERIVARARGDDHFSTAGRKRPPGLYVVVT